MESASMSLLLMNERKKVLQPPDPGTQIESVKVSLQYITLSGAISRLKMFVCHFVTQSIFSPPNVLTLKMEENGGKKTTIIISNHGICNSD